MFSLSSEELAVFERIAASYALAVSSFKVLLQDKKLIIFPILSGLGCLLVVASFALPFVAHPQWLDFQNNQANNGQVPWWTYVVAFAFYFCNYFVITFCNAALISCALIRFNGGEPTIGDGLSAAVSRLPQILAWALVSATVGLILKAIENSNEKFGRFISSILGTAWTVMTFFVVPVLVVEKVGPIDAVKRSIAVLKKTWGEALVGRFGMGLFLFLLALPAVLLVFAGIALLAGALKAVGVVLLVLAVLYFLLYAAVSSAVQGIFVGALYQYAAHGAVPSGFDQSYLDSAFQSKP
jgi:hypothetical protein